MKKQTGGHAACATCKATFPRSWFQTRGAIRKDGHDFCGQKCADNYKPNEGHSATWLIARTFMT